MEDVDLRSIEKLTRSLEERFMSMFPDITREPPNSGARRTRCTRTLKKAGKDDIVGSAEKDALREWWRDLQSVISSIKRFTEKRVAAGHGSEAVCAQEHNGASDGDAAEESLTTPAVVPASVSLQTEGEHPGLPCAASLSISSGLDSPVPSVDMTVDQPCEAEITATEGQLVPDAVPEHALVSLNDGSSSCDPPPPPSRVLEARGPESIQGDIRYRWEAAGQGNLKILILMPTTEQLRDLKDRTQNNRPALFARADALGARQHGAFVIEIPKHDLPPLPDRSVMKRNCRTYSPNYLQHGTYRMETRETEASLKAEQVTSMTVTEAEAKMKERLESGEMSDVFYETDIPAGTEEDRIAAGLPRESLIAGIRGNQLDTTAYSIEGMHTPTGYRGTPFAPFAWHDENFWAAALNILYSGRKIWYWTRPASGAAANDEFRLLPLLQMPDNDQYLQDEALFGGVDYLRERGVDVMSFEQQPGQIIYLYSRVLHSGFSISGTVAEAINYADELWRQESQGYKPRKRKHPGGRLPISWAHMREREPGVPQLREGEARDASSAASAQQDLVTDQPSPETRPGKRKTDASSQKNDRGQKKSRVESAIITDLQKLAGKMKKVDELCNIPSFDENNPPSTSVYRLAIAIHSRLAVRQYCSLIRNHRKRGTRPRFDVSEDVSTRIKQRLAAIDESGNDKIKLRLHQWFLAKEIEESKKGSIRADSSVIKRIRDDLGWTEAKFDHIYKKGRKWKEICDDGLLCFIPLAARNDFDVSPTNYRELKSGDIAMLHQLLDNDYTRSINEAGKQFLSVLMGANDVEFRWESENIPVDELPEKEMLYYLQPFATTRENIYDLAKYSQWPRPVVWPEEWPWPADPTRIQPDQKQCDFCTKKRACKCIHEIFPALTPLIKLYDDKGFGLEACANRPGQIAYKKDEVIGQLTGEIAPLDTYNDNWTLELVRPDLEDAPACQIHCAEVGNIFRLVNHSCEPLAQILERRASGRWIMAIVAKQDIYDGSEVTVSYGKRPVRCLCRKCGSQKASALARRRQPRCP